MNSTNKHTFCDIMFFDYSGIKRSKTVLEPIEEKVSFDASSINIGVDIADSDMYLIPDKNSTLLLDDRRIYVGEIDSVLSPRRLLKNTLSDYEKKGLRFKTGIEPEFYITQNGKLLDAGTYLKGSDHNFTKNLLEALDVCDFKPMMGHHEVGPGQYEFGYKGDEPVKIGDSLGFFKSIVRSTAMKMGYDVTFMPKPYIDHAGNGMHTHISVWDYDGKNEKNIFEDDKRSMLHFVGGLIKYARDISALTVPSVNSYKRLGASEAPAYVVWGHGNRSALVRIPHAGDRVEYRAPDCSANPYLAFAAMIRAGMEGIDKGIEPPKELRTSSYDLGKNAKHPRLPYDLREALHEFKHSKFVKSILPPEMFENYIKVKEGEIRQFMNQVTDLEHDMYWFV